MGSNPTFGTIRPVKPKKRLTHADAWLVQWAFNGHPACVSLERLLTAPLDAFETVPALFVSATGQRQDARWEIYRPATEDALVAEQLKLWQYVRSRGMPAWIGRWLTARAAKAARKEMLSWRRRRPSVPEAG